ncbi:hypothetical protein BTO20_06035 [Mycobacterium dioxanotrophicus]|uniref:DUF2746 domain-containing protein n=1 Tax=Mycobacterium dioxanotrophicus TaxID=482462 RepID=A0A1Y0BZ60_9MYCO|nr:DUF2746 domain-containing protein [Mycobacterium dioxanotrophicus]ART68199.1 hypothetical protein BTO20_06035 [Mycobacterium dioxanotrophicus]
MNWGEIDNAWAFLAVLAGLVTNLVIMIIGQRRGIKRRDEDREVLSDVKANTDVVRYQVKNDHPDEENLRDQLDRMEAHITEMSRRQLAHGRDISGLREDVGAVRDDVGGLRGELRDDRTNLREFKAGVNGFIKRVHPGEDPL